MESLPQIWIEDVSNRQELVDVAGSIFCSEYSRLFCEGLSPAELRPDFDKVVGKSNVRTLMAFGTSKAVPTARILATTTFRFGSLYVGDRYPLELMELVHPPCGWDRYSHEEFRPERTVEGTLFAFARDITDAETLPLRIEIFRQLHSAGMMIGRQHGCDRYWSILLKSFARFVRSQVKLPCIATDEMLLNEETHGDLFDRYPRYWRRGSPGVYITKTPATNYSLEKTAHNVRRS